VNISPRPLRGSDQHSDCAHLGQNFGREDWGHRGVFLPVGEVQAEKGDAGPTQREWVHQFIAKGKGRPTEDAVPLESERSIKDHHKKKDSLKS